MWNDLFRGVIISKIKWENDYDRTRNMECYADGFDFECNVFCWNGPDDLAWI